MGLTRYEDDPMGSSRFHKVLVLTNNMQRLPSILIIVILVFLASVLSLFWLNPDVPLIYLLAASLNWVILWALPRFKRSYGPEKASTLALAFLMMVVLAILGIFRAADWIAYVFLAVVTLVVYYSTWVEPFKLGVTHEMRLTNKLEQTDKALKLLHIGDLHMEFMTPRERDLNAKIKAFKPDVIVFSGDFVNISYTHEDHVKKLIREVISEWQAPLGTYVVPGTYTVEPLERFKALTEGLDNIRPLLDEWVTLDIPGGKLHILGMVTTHILKKDQARFAELMQQAPSDGVKLLLTHAPDLAHDADAAGIDLYLCGHTHGGQIRLPFIGALFSGSHLGMDFVMGRRDLKHTSVYTTRGVGLEGLGAPRARFLCPPEIILWEIRGQP
jgi:uncharacterized protein